MAKVVGKGTYRRTGRRYTWSKQSGWQSEVRYEGEARAVRRLISRYAPRVDEVTYDTNGPTATLVARINRDTTGGGGGVNDADVTTTWELIGQDTQKDIREHWRLHALNPNTMKDIEKKAAEWGDDATKDYDTDAFDVAIHTGSGTTTNTSAWSAEAKFFFFLLTKGQESYIETEYIIRKTELVASDYQRAMATTGVNYLWTTALLTAAEGIPPMIQATASEIPSPTFTVDGDISGTGYTYKWLWLKKSPQITQVAGGKFERNQEWQLNIWPNFLYPEAG